jgi:hypothetical protein
MEDVRIILAALWICLMFTYLLGDVLRIFSGDFVPGQMAGEQAVQRTWFAAALLMLVPIIMIFLSLILLNPVIGWLNIIFAIILLVVNLAGLRSYPGYYDRFLWVLSSMFLRDGMRGIG